MVQKGLSGYFETFLKRASLFDDKGIIQSNYTPESINHRDAQIQQLADILAPSLKLEKPSNLFIYGKTGTGKTVCVKFTTNEMMKVSQEKEIPLNVIYLNCKLKKVADTEYRLMAELARELGKPIPATGLPTDEVYKIFVNALESKKQFLILVLDEIDQLIKKVGDEILYNLTRMNTELRNSQLTIIGISNDLIFANNLDPRVKSSLSEEEVIFPPYNAMQIQDILKQRAKKAFKKESLEAGTIEKCAAYAAREHGDARRAIELMRVAGELAERKGDERVTVKHIDDAEEKIERDRVLDIVTTQPKQFQAVLYSILSVYSKRKDMIFTGEIYDVYKGLCLQTSLRPLTQRRVSDVIAELDMLGIINAKVVSKGRYGRTREITLAVPDPNCVKIKKVLDEALDLS